MQLTKPAAVARIGLTLGGGESPLVERVATDGLAAGVLCVGDRIVTVNGTHVVGHDMATKMLKAATGEVVLAFGSSLVCYGLDTRT